MATRSRASSSAAVSAAVLPLKRRADPKTSALQKTNKRSKDSYEPDARTQRATARQAADEAAAALQRAAEIEAKRVSDAKAAEAAAALQRAREQMAENARDLARGLEVMRQVKAERAANLGHIVKDAAENRKAVAVDTALVKALLANADVMKFTKQEEVQVRTRGAHLPEDPRYNDWIATQGVYNARILNEEAFHKAQKGLPSDPQPNAHTTMLLTMSINYLRKEGSENRKKIQQGGRRGLWAAIKAMVRWIHTRTTLMGFNVKDDTDTRARANRFKDIVATIILAGGSGPDSEAYRNSLAYSIRFLLYDRLQRTNEGNQIRMDVENDILTRLHNILMSEEGYIELTDTGARAQSTVKPDDMKLVKADYVRTYAAAR